MSTIRRPVESSTHSSSRKRGTDFPYCVEVITVSRTTSKPAAPA
jgi:hypothetical protein